MKVSVLVITYNQENYIRQAIESILHQRTDFEYEIVVGEDKSTDGTRQILFDLHKEYPGRINLL
ncbi:MAG TPA: glycosyltransferase, partial [Blastocatellia bacterium]